MNTYKIVWYWVEDGCIRGKVIFSADNEEAVIKEWKQLINLDTQGWYDIVKR